MKTKNNFLLPAGLILLFTVCMPACEKENETNSPPTCKITNPINGEECIEGEIIKISISASDNDGSISEVSYSIDGTKKGSLNSPPFDFEWNTNGEAIGSHKIQAVSTDNGQKTSADEITIDLIDGNLPMADFTTDQTWGEAPLTVQFTDQSTENPISWLWDFGDGSTSTEQNPMHVYDAMGLYTVTVTAKNDAGSGTEIKKNYIKVIELIVDSRDNQTYETVKIGTQTWFAENLNFETENSWWYKNEAANGDIYGRLYTWDAAVIACPGGWHLPTDDEWKILELYLGMSIEEVDRGGGLYRGIDEGQRLKSATGWLELLPGTDEVGFAALPGGERNTSGMFTYKGSIGVWWTASTYVEARWNRAIGTNETGIYRGVSNPNYGCSVRCIKN